MDIALATLLRTILVLKCLVLEPSDPQPRTNPKRKVFVAVAIDALEASIFSARTRRRARRRVLGLRPDGLTLKIHPDTSGSRHCAESSKKRYGSGHVVLPYRLFVIPQRSLEPTAVKLHLPAFQICLRSLSANHSSVQRNFLHRQCAGCFVDQGRSPVD